MMTNGSLEWTLGEIMIETYFKPVGFLSQGFQQPTKVTITDLEKDIENNIVAYPNPAQGQLNVRISEAGTHTIELFNLQGQKLINEKFIAHPANATFEMDVQPLGAAMYLLKVTNISSGKNHIQKIEKY